MFFPFIQNGLSQLTTAPLLSDLIRMLLPLVSVCVGLAIAGLLFQSLLHGNLRLMIYPLNALLGVAAGYLAGMDQGLDFALSVVAFCLGMAGRAAMGGYWNCVAMELGCMAFGVLVGIYLL
jgi:hypothetical protein